MKSISLFASAGIGELGLLSNGLEIIAANELLSDRCALYSENYPGTKVFEGDIWSLKDELVEWSKEKLGDEELFLIYATPPCQGMSSNGAGKIKSEVAAGRRPEIDERNRLVIPGVEVIKRLRPKWVLFENVPAMQGTLIDADGEVVEIIDYIRSQLGSEYIGEAMVVKCSDYGVPQLRRRLLTIFTRDEAGKKFLQSNGNRLLGEEDKLPEKTLWDAIGHLPPLEAREGKNSDFNFHPMHFVNVMNDEKYWWIQNTPEGQTAYNNQCVNPECLYQGNPEHIDVVEQGKAVSSKVTPIYCLECKSLLPRPTIIDKKTGERRLISGFHSAYRRMDRNLPARTLTRNFPFEASDNKVHPTQNRVLSIYEALVLQTIADYDYQWKIKGKPVSKSLIAVNIGESVPPKLIDLVVNKMIRISNGTLLPSQLPLMAETSVA